MQTTKTGHTPGPWVYEPKTGWITPQKQSDNPDERVRVADAYPIMADLRPAAVNANGQLIAAAPDLLEALYRVRNFLASSSPALAGSHCMEVVESTIAKATGGAA